MGIKLPDTHTPANLGKSMCVSKSLLRGRRRKFSPDHKARPSNQHRLPFWAQPFTRKLVLVLNWGEVGREKGAHSGEALPSARAARAMHTLKNSAGTPVLVADEAKAAL